MRSALCLFTVCVAISAVAGAEEPKLINEKLLLTRDAAEGGFGRMQKWNGTWSVRISPGAKHLLYIRREQVMIRRKPDEAPRQRSAYRFVLREVNTGKDNVLPIPALMDDDPLYVLMQMNMFGPEGKRIVFSTADDPDGDGYVEFGRKGCLMQPAVYDIAAQKLRKLDVKDDMVIASFNRTGKNILIFKGDDRGRATSLHITPTDKLQLKSLNIGGIPLNPCPKADIIPLLLMPQRPGSRPAQSEKLLMLYDVQSDKEFARLSRSERMFNYFIFQVQWTADGRYMYYAELQVMQDDDTGRKTGRKLLTRIWDRKDKKEAALLDGVISIGTGPGDSTVVLSKVDTKQEKFTGIFLHDMKTNISHTIRGDDVRLLDARGKFVIYAKKAKDGKEPIYLAEIEMPKPRSPEKPPE